MSSAPTGSNPPVDAGGEVLIKIKTLEPATYEIYVDRQITVAALKAKLEGVVQNAPAIRQRIIFRGRGLQDEQTLRDLGVENGDTFHLVVRPADVPAAAGSGQAPPQPQSLQDRLNADTRRILEQISQTMNINMGFNIGNPQGGNAAAPGGRQQQQAPVPHLFTTLHRFLQRLGEDSYTPPNIPLMSNAFVGASPQADFEALSRAMTELLQDVELPSHLITMREEARRDLAGRGQQEQQQAVQASSENRTTGEGPGTAAEGEGNDASGNGAAEGAQRSGRRAGNARPSRLDYTGASYGYRYLPLAAASLASLLDRTEAHVSGCLARQLRQGAASARVLEINEAAVPEAHTELYRRLRQLGGQLHATAALLIDMSRGILSTVAALEGSPRTFAANTAAALRADGSDADLPPLVPRALARGRGAPAEMGFIGPIGPMGGWMDVFGAQFSMPMGAQGTEDEGNRAPTPVEADTGAPGARGQPTSGVAVGSVHIDLGDLPNMPGGIGGFLNNIISAVTGGAVMPVPEGVPGNAAPGGGPADAARRTTPAAVPRGDNADSGAEVRRPSDSALTLIIPALTSVAGSIAASVMQILGGRTVNARMLLQALSRALSEHLRHVLDVLTARWDRLQRTAARRRRAARAQQQRRQSNDEEAAVGSQSVVVASTGSSNDNTAATPSDTLEEFRHVAPLINQLFPSWESVLQVTAEASDGENGQESDEEGSSSGQEGYEAEGTGQEAAGTVDGRQEPQTQEAGQQQRSRRRQGARDVDAASDRSSTLNDEMSSMLRMLMPPMADSIGRSVAQSVYAALASRTDPLDGQQLAVAILQTLVSRLDVVADMVLANWPRIASGLEQIETASEGVSAMEVMSRMVDLAATIMSGAPAPGASPASRGAGGRPPESRTPATSQGPQAPSPQGLVPNAAAETDATPAQVPPTAHPTAPQAQIAAASSAVANSAASDAHPSPSGGLMSAQHKPTVESATAPAEAIGSEIPDDALQQSANPAAAGGEEDMLRSSGADASGAGPEMPAAPAVAPSAAPKGLGLGLRPKKKLNSVATGSASGADPTASSALRGLAAGTAKGTDKESKAGAGPDAIGQGPEARVSTAASSSAAAGLQAVLRQALGTNRRSTAHSPGADTDRTGPEPDAAPGDPLDGLLEMMGHVIGTLDPRETGGDVGPIRASGGSGRAGSDAAAGGAGGPLGGGAGLGGLLQMAQNIASDPAMQPMIGNMMNMVLGGGAGANRGDASSSGLSGLLGSLLGGLPAAPSASSGTRRQGSSGTAEQVGYEVLAEVLGAEAGSHWRKVIERDVEEMQQHVQVAAEEHSANYRKGVPSRRGTLLSALGGTERSGTDEGDEEEEYDVEDVEQGETEEDNGR